MNGYKGQEIVIINDFTGKISFRQLCQMVDKYPYTVPIRRNEIINFCSKKVIISSDKLPEKIFNFEKVDDDINRFYRRFKVFKLLDINGNIEPIECEYNLPDIKDSDDDNENIEFINGEYVIKAENISKNKKKIKIIDSNTKD